MATEIKHLCFDLDGTLIDSLSLMSKSWGQVQKDFNVNQSFKEYKKYIGIPFDEILALLKIPKKNMHELEIFIMVFRKNIIKNLTCTLKLKRL